MDDAKEQYTKPEVKKYNQMMMSLYFGTLESVYVISRQMGYVHTELPDFASQLLIHVTKDNEKGFLVSVTYNKNPIKLGGDCKGEESCSFDDFKSFIKTLMADASEISKCEPVQDVLYLTEMTTDVKDTTTIELIVLMSILAFFSLLIGGLLGHRAADKENKKRRIQVNVFDQESLLP